MSPLRILTWSIDSRYLYSLSQTGNIFYVPTREGRPEGYAGRQGASVVEGYPVTDAGTGRRSQLSSGTVGMFERAGFSMPAPPSGRRVLMRLQVTPGR